MGNETMNVKTVVKRATHLTSLLFLINNIRIAPTTGIKVVIESIG
jgi:hypothetical protein